jgi:hypothetical protein
MRNLVEIALVGMATVIVNGLLASQPSLADQNLNCGAYAATAVEQQNQNAALGCGLKGGAWHADFQRHFNWCVQPNVKMANLTKEDNYRKDALAQCSARRSACEKYASSAVAAQGVNQQMSCGYSGGGWHSDYQRHFGWCIVAQAGAPDQVAVVRKLHLEQCAKNKAR